MPRRRRRASPYADIAPLPATHANLNLYWRGWFGTLGPYYFVGLNQDEGLLRQFVSEYQAGHPCRISLKEYDKILAIAGRHGYSLTTFGGPEDDERLREHRRSYLAANKKC